MAYEAFGICRSAVAWRACAAVARGAHGKAGDGIAEAILQQYGTKEFLSRLSDPFWFQALGAVMGMDWHSSGITTSVLGALKRGMNPARMNWGSTFAVDAGSNRGVRRMSY